MHGVHRDQAVSEAKLGDQLPGRRDLVGFVGDLKMTQDQMAIAGKRADQVGGGLVGDMIVAAAQGLPVDGKQRQGVFGRRPKLPAVLAKDLFQGRDIEASQEIAQRRRPAPAASAARTACRAAGDEAS